MDDNKEQEEIKIRKMITDYAAHSSYKLNPDTKTVDRVVKGVGDAQDQIRVRILSVPIGYGDAEKDKKIICPCVYHVEEIEREGECHCQLFVGAKKGEPQKV